MGGFFLKIGGNRVIKGDSAQTLLGTALDGGVLTVTLDRPQVHNALNPQLIAELTRLFREVDAREEVRVVVLTGAGSTFCAGGDLASMRAAADFDFQENVAGGQAIFDLMAAVDRCSKPVVGRINGSAFGGGTGLVSCCDLAIAVEHATFAFSEVRLGLIPAVISPFVLRKIGPGYARELFLTGEKFDTLKALHIGLIHQVSSVETLDDAVNHKVALLLQGAPEAQAAAKEITRMGEQQSIDEQRLAMAEILARRRASREGREGMSAFLEKRKPDWQGG
jgi:methylglutaconyl-CoA hydratase